MNQEKELAHGIPSTLTLRHSFLFPIDSAEGRRDMVVGGLAILFLWPIGWILNLGARLDVVHRLYKGDEPYFRAFRPWPRTLMRGCISAAAIFGYLLPANLCFSLAGWQYLAHGLTPLVLALLGAGILFFIWGVFTLPGCMTVYACERDPSVLWHPLRAFRRAWEHRGIYLKAWWIALASVAISFLGLLAMGVGFFFTSVWAWEVVGYAFTVAIYSQSRAPEQ